MSVSSALHSLTASRTHTTVVNLALIGTAGYQFYTRPEIRTDRKVVGGTLAGALVLFGAEGWLAEAYAQTENGQREAQRAREEGSAVWRHTREVVLRPGVLSGLLGIGASAGYLILRR